MERPTLYLMLGYPGAGKTTAAKLIAELTGAVHLWADAERRRMFDVPTYSHAENLKLYAQLDDMTENLLGAGQSVIFDTNFNFYKDRALLRKIAAKHNAKSVLIWITTPKELAKRRATEQSQDQETRVLGNMPAKEFDRMSRNLQPPHADEPYVEIDGRNVTIETIRRVLEAQ